MFFILNACYIKENNGNLEKIADKKYNYINKKIKNQTNKTLIHKYIKRLQKYKKFIIKKALQLLDFIELKKIK